MLLTFTIKKQLIRRTDCEIPVAKSENYLYAQFSFSDEWVGTKTAIFNNGTAYSAILDEDNKCLVPWEVITESGFSVSVYCGDRITANISFVKVLPTGYIEGQTPADPTPTVYEQILAELNKKLEALNIKAGQNVTVDIDGDDVIINSTGGGTGDAYTKAETDALLDGKQNVLTNGYEDLTNKPSINGTTLSGNKTSAQLGIQIEIDSAMSDTSENAVQNKVIKGYVDTATTDKVASLSVSTIWTGTQTEYDAITTKDSNTLYFIVEASNGV